MSSLVYVGMWAKAEVKQNAHVITAFKGLIIGRRSDVRNYYGANAVILLVEHGAFQILVLRYEYGKRLACNKAFLTLAASFVLSPWCLGHLVYVKQSKSDLIVEAKGLGASHVRSLQECTATRAQLTRDHHPQHTRSPMADAGSPDTSPSDAQPNSALPNGNSNPPSALPTSPTTPRLNTQQVLEYLRQRGFKRAEQAFLEDASKTQSLSELASQNLPGEDVPAKVDPEQAGKDAAMIAALRSRGRDEAVVLDPSERGEAFRQLESWVDGSLDIYRVRCFGTFIGIVVLLIVTVWRAA